MRDTRMGLREIKSNETTQKCLNANPNNDNVWWSISGCRATLNWAGQWPSRAQKNKTIWTEMELFAIVAANKYQRSEKCSKQANNWLRWAVDLSLAEGNKWLIFIRWLFVFFSVATKPLRSLLVAHSTSIGRCWRRSAGLFIFVYFVQSPESQLTPSDVPGASSTYTKALHNP